MKISEFLLDFILTKRCSLKVNGLNPYKHAVATLERAGLQDEIICLSFAKETLAIISIVKYDYLIIENKAGMKSVGFVEVVNNFQACWATLERAGL